jgi:hypothetical protein
MVNLLKFRAKAEYKDRRSETITGQEAYMRYGAEMRKIVERAGVPSVAFAIRLARRALSFIQNGMKPHLAIVSSRSPSLGSMRTMGIWSVGAIL